MSEELKPCPFCGGSAEMKDGYPYVLIKCRDCSARTMHPVKAEAVEQWNARVEEAKLAKVRKVVEQSTRGSTHYEGCEHHHPLCRIAAIIKEHTS